MPNRLPVVAALFLASCASEPPPEASDVTYTGDHTADAFEEYADQSTGACLCWWSEAGWASATECIDARAIWLTPVQRQCFHNVGLAYPQFEDHEACVAAAERKRTDCYKATQSCDSTTWDACDDTIVQCPASCLSLDTACQDAYDAYTAALNSCF